MKQQKNSMPLIGDPAPEFEAVTTQGPIKFPEDFQGNGSSFSRTLPILRRYAQPSL
jgi:hypothetical protein